MRELEATELRMRETEEEVRETERAAHEVSPGHLQANSSLPKPNPSHFTSSLKGYGHELNIFFNVLKFETLLFE
jgi:hypothetical protein